MVTDGDHACGKHQIRYRLVESLCYTHETNVTSCVNSTPMEKKFHLKEKFHLEMENITFLASLIIFRIVSLIVSNCALGG